MNEFIKKRLKMYKDRLDSLNKLTRITYEHEKEKVIMLAKINLLEEMEVVCEDKDSCL